MQFDLEHFGKQVNSSWGDSQASMNLPLGSVEPRDNIIKSCRTSHSELVPLEEQTGLSGSLVRGQSYREEFSQLQQYNLKLLVIIDTLKLEVTRLSAEILEKDGRLKYHADRSAEVRKEFDEMKQCLQSKEDQMLMLESERQTDKQMIDSLRQQASSLTAEIERFRRLSVESKFRVPPIQIHSPQASAQDLKLALSDIKYESKLRIPEPQQHEEDETNLFEISNYTESDTRKEVVNMTPRRSPPEKHEDTPIGRCVVTECNQPSGMFAMGSFLEAENKRLKRRIAELTQALSTCQKLLGDMERKSQTLQSYYEQKITKLQIKIDLMKHHRS